MRGMPWISTLHVLTWCIDTICLDGRCAIACRDRKGASHENDPHHDSRYRARHSIGQRSRGTDNDRDDVWWQHERKWTIACGTADDAPRHGWQPGIRDLDPRPAAV